MDAAALPTWRVVRFGLLVTGKGEAKFLPELFRSLISASVEHCTCTFSVIRKVEQLRPKTSQKSSRQKIVGTNTALPTRDVEIAQIAHGFLNRHADSFVILVDDLEAHFAPRVAEVFARYRDGFDQLLKDRKHRASVHFLVNMVEAYFFAHTAAVNAVLGTSMNDHHGDVEEIRHPKNDLKSLFTGYDEIDHGAKIMTFLDIPHVLSRPDHCRSLRTLFGWCWRSLGLIPSDGFQLAQGRYHAVTQRQIYDLPLPPTGHSLE